MFDTLLAMGVGAGFFVTHVRVGDGGSEYDALISPARSSDAESR